jgi:hypothetical protein
MATAANHWSKRLQPRAARKGALTTSPNVEVVTALSARATERDRWLLRMLAEHRVLTTTQITALAFGSARVARARLQMLRAHRAIFGTRPRTGAGSLPWHWVLDEAGARLLAADDGVIEVKRWGWRRDHALAPLSAATLAHTVGANWLGTALVQHVRGVPGARVEAWWGEHRCTQVVGDYVHPDGYLHYTDASGTAECWIEYDTGTEPHHRLVAKADRYLALTEATEINLPVLFMLPATTREATLRRHLADVPVAGATTTPNAVTAAGGPAGPAWLPVGHGRARQHLARLGAIGQQNTGRCWHGDAPPRPAERAGARRAVGGRGREVQRRDRRRPRRQPPHDQDPRQPVAGQALRQGPRPARRHRVRDWPGPTG